MTQTWYGVVIAQPGIYYGLPHIFYLVGVYLSTQSCDVYLVNMVHSLRALMEVFNLWVNEWIKLGSPTVVAVQAVVQRKCD